MKPLIVVQLTIRRSALERLYDELLVLQKRYRAGHVRYALRLVREGRYVARPEQTQTTHPDAGAIVVKLQFKESDAEYPELEELGPALRAGPLRAKLSIYCQGGALVDTSAAPVPSPALTKSAPNADEDIADAFSLAVEPLNAAGN